MLTGLRRNSYTRFVALLKAAVQERRLTQQQIAARLKIGQGMVSRTLNQQRRIDAVSLGEWRLAMGMSWDEVGALIDDALKAKK